MSQVTVAWKCIAGWLLSIALGFGGAATPRKIATAHRARWLLKALVFESEHLGPSVHAKAVRNWVKAACLRDLHDRVAVNWLRDSARLM